MKLDEEATTKTYWVPYSNTDLTEGRGRPIALAVCTCRTTAERLGKGKGPMGSHCYIKPITAIAIDGQWYFPQSCVNVEYPTEMDEKEQESKDLQQKTLQRAQELGLTKKELEILGVKV